MSLLLTVARASVAVNVALLAALAYVWLGNYRRHGATYTLTLLVFAGFLLVQNVVWGVLYVGDVRYVDWFLASDFDMRLQLTFLCTFETAGLSLLAWLTWK